MRVWIGCGLFTIEVVYFGVCFNVGFGPLVVGFDLWGLLLCFLAPFLVVDCLRCERVSDLILKLWYVYICNTILFNLILCFVITLYRVLFRIWCVESGLKLCFCSLLIPIFALRLCLT